MEGRGRWRWWGLKLRVEGGGGVKEREGFAKRSAGGRESRETEENGQRGQDAKGVINEGSVTRWMDEEGKRRREKECEAAVYLPNKLDRISSIIKERDGENTLSHTHTHTHKSRRARTCTHTHTHTHTHTDAQKNFSSSGTDHTPSFSHTPANQHASTQLCGSVRACVGVSVVSARGELLSCVRISQSHLQLVGESPRPLQGRRLI